MNKWLIITLSTIGFILITLIVFGVIALNRITDVSESTCNTKFALNTPESFRQLDLDGNETTLDANYVMPEYEAVTFASRDQEAQLSGWFIPAQGVDATSAKTVVLVHGISGCKKEPLVLRPAGMLNKNGFNVLMFDLRNHGESEITDGRATNGAREQQDVLGAYDWVNNEGYANNGVGLIGFSLGAATSILAYEAEPGFSALWADSSYSDFTNALRRELSRNGYPSLLVYSVNIVGRFVLGTNIFAFSPLDSVKNISGRSIQFVHGQADERIEPTDAQELFDAAVTAGVDADLWYVEDAGHIQSVYYAADEYEDRLMDFFSSLSR